MKVAVIGARGYVGRHLCAKLEQQGAAVLRYSAGEANGISRRTGLLPEGFAFPTGLDAVYFLAQSPHYRQMPEQSAHLLSVNCAAAVQAAEAARRAGAKRLVYASTGNVYAPSFEALAEDSPVRRDNWYSLSKVMAEDALTLYQAHLEIAVARIFGVYGPSQEDKLVPSIVSKVRSGTELFVDRNPRDDMDHDGLKVSLIYIDDIVSCLIELSSNSHRGPINLAGSEVISVRDLAMSAGKVLEIEPKISLSNKYRDFDLIAETSLSRWLFGDPRVTFEEGLKRVLLDFESPREQSIRVS